MRGGPTALGGSILFADGYWLQFNVISKHKALREDLVSCVAKAFGKRYGLSEMRSTPAKTTENQVEQEASHGPGAAGASPGQSLVRWIVAEE